MRNVWAMGISLAVLACIESCGSGSGSGGKASSTPLLLNVLATPTHTWVNGPVTFTATCVGLSGNNSGLTYVWNFGDGSTDTTSVASDTHSYAAAPAGSGISHTYNYSVTCQQGASTPATSPSQPEVVWQYDLTTVASTTCSSGVQGWGWCYQNPVPTGANLKAISATSPLSAWTVGASGAVLATVDGGATWVPKYPWLELSGSAPVFLDVQAIDQNNATIIGADGSVLTTKDAGSNWTRTNTPPPGLSLFAAALVNSQDAWALSDSDFQLYQYSAGVWKKNSGIVGGIEQEAINDGTYNSGSPIAANASNAWYISLGGLQFVYNAATKKQEPLPRTVEPISISVTSSSKCGNSSANEPSLWVGGVNPLNAGPASASRLVSGTASSWMENGGGSGGGAPLKAFDQVTAWAQSTLSSTDYPASGASGVTPIQVSYTNIKTGADTWQQSAAFLFTTTITAFDSSDCIHGWGVGVSGGIARTTDGAQTWLRQAISNEGAGVIGNSTLYSVAAASTSMAYVVGATGLFATSDGGVTWRSVLQPTGSGSSGAAIFGRGSSDYSSAASDTAPAIATNTMGYAVAIPFEVDSNNTPLAPTTSIYDFPAPGIAGIASDFSTAPAGGWPSGLPADFVPNFISVAVCQKTAWVLDSSGVVLVENLSGDGATGWQVLPVLAPPSDAIACFDGPSPSAAVTGSTDVAGISVTTTGGAQWSTTNPIPGSGPGPASITIPSASCASLVPGSSCTIFTTAEGAEGTIVKSGDAGITWTVASMQANTLPSVDAHGVSIQSWNFFSPVAAADAHNAWVVGSYFTAVNNIAPGLYAVLHTIDGVNWTIEPFSPSGYYDVSSADKNTAWIVGGAGSILKTSTAGCSLTQTPCLPK